ncbi:MAG: hypothetical protein COB36_09145 [Alphaproteobacteria bacterium]|nr:MAG: hypothetical protein COB36_09145 [Alphaproteobacteria bacterium]
MKITTQDKFVEEDIIETLGIVQGSSIRSRNVGKDIMAGLRSIIGGELIEYTKLMAESREQALDRMIADATEKGANGVVGLRFSTSAVMSGAAEILVYGTAVKLK